MAAPLRYPLILLAWGTMAAVLVAIIIGRAVDGGKWRIREGNGQGSANLAATYWRKKKMCDSRYRTAAAKK